MSIYVKYFIVSFVDILCGEFEESLKNHLKDICIKGLGTYMYTYVICIHMYVCKWLL